MPAIPHPRANVENNHIWGQFGLYVKTLSQKTQARVIDFNVTDYCWDFTLALSFKKHLISDLRCDIRKEYSQLSWKFWGGRFSYLGMCFSVVKHMPDICGPGSISSTQRSISSCCVMFGFLYNCQYSRKVINELCKAAIVLICTIELVLSHCLESPLRLPFLWQQLWPTEFFTESCTPLKENTSQFHTSSFDHHLFVPFLPLQDRIHQKFPHFCVFSVW